MTAPNSRTVFVRFTVRPGFKTIGLMSTSILVADDDPAIAPLVQTTLSREDWNILTAANGSEASTLLENQSVDLVITDLDMPNMDGRELTKLVSERYPTIPVLVLTGKGSEQAAVSCFRAGAADYVAKADLQREMRDVVVRLIREEQALDQLAGEGAGPTDTGELIQDCTSATGQYTVLKWGTELKRMTADLGEETKFAPEKLRVLRRQAERLEKWGKLDAAATQRRHERRFFADAVFVIPFDENRQPDLDRRFITFCRNISPGGCSLLHSRLFRIREFILFFSHLADGSSRPAAIEAQVIRDRPLPMGMYEIGISFVKLAQFPEEEIRALAVACRS